MKKFISLLIASAMVVSLVPATAFAGQDVTATAKVVGAKTITETTAVNGTMGDAPELQIKIADATYSGSDSDPAASTVKTKITVTVDDVKFPAGVTAATWENESGVYSTAFAANKRGATGYGISTARVDDDEILITIQGMLFENDVITVPLNVDYSDLDDGDYATVSVDSDMVEADDITFITCVDRGVEASVKDLVTVADDEVQTLKDITVKETVAGSFETGDVLRMELSKGFEFESVLWASSIVGVKGVQYDDEYAYFELDSTAIVDGAIKFSGLQIFADGVDEGDVATIEVTLYDTYKNGTISEVTSKIAECEIEVAEVCDYTVAISVDEDEDVPVFYSGVNSDNFGINDNADHKSLEVKIAESFPGAWSYRDEWELTLPEGVYVTEVSAKDNVNWTYANAIGTATVDAEDAFHHAYQEGKYESFVFEKRKFAENTSNKVYEIEFTLELTAAPDFEGEVVLGFVGDGVKEDEVVIAEFVAPYTIEASQNDVIIDYRNTPIDTPVVITEAEAELFSDEMAFTFSLDSYMSFDSDGEVAVTEDSEMEVDVDTVADATAIKIQIEEESDNEAAVLTWSGIELYMHRALAAGAYALDVKTTASEKFMAEKIFANKATVVTNDNDVYAVGDVIDGTEFDSGAYSVEVSEKFVNIVTAGSDQANTFTTQVIVPVDENVIYSGGVQIELDVPAYISAAGYTMLPVRAVANAIGVATSNVLWDGPTNQVTIIYGTKTIAMVVGQSYMVVNGTSIPTTAAPEITDGRAFLPLRDLAMALSISDDKIVWDKDTRTVTLN